MSILFFFFVISWVMLRGFLTDELDFCQRYDLCLHTVHTVMMPVSWFCDALQGWMDGFGQTVED